MKIPPGNCLPYCSCIRLRHKVVMIFITSWAQISTHGLLIELSAEEAKTDKTGNRY